MLEGLFSPCIYWLFSELPCSCSGRKSFLNSAKELGKAFVASKQPSAEKKPALQQPPLPATKAGPTVYPVASEGPVPTFVILILQLDIPVLEVQHAVIWY